MCSNTCGEFQYVAQQQRGYDNARSLVGVAWVWPYIGLWWVGCWGRRADRSTVHPRSERERERGEGEGRERGGREREREGREGDGREGERGEVR